MKETDNVLLASEYVCKKCGYKAKSTDAMEICPQCNETKSFISQSLKEGKNTTKKRRIL